jgi:archaeosortase A (PGF-CTERM-specific)
MITDTLLIGSCLLLASGTLGYHFDREQVGRVAGAGGFLALGTLLSVLAYGYAMSTRPDATFLVIVSSLGALIAFQGIKLVLGNWERAAQLTTTVGGIVLIILPFELFPGLVVGMQEFFAAQTVFVLEVFGYQPTMETTTGNALAQLRFENGGYYYVARECTGIDGVALFGGIILGARATWRQKAKGIAFMLVAVYVVNIVRLIFVAAAIGGDWFGPHFTDGQTIQTSYFVAEVAIGQTVVVVASVAGILFVNRWIPDLLSFANDLLSSFTAYGSDISDHLKTT